MNLRESLRKAIKEQCFAYGNGSLGNYGCMDSTATNYDPFATHPCNASGPSIACADCNGNTDWCGPGVAPGDCCEYPTSVPGCMDPSANNYNPAATIDDGSCTFNVTHLFTDCTGIVPGSAIGMTWSGLVGYDSSQPANNSQLFYNFLGTPNPGEVVKVDTANITLCLQYDGTTTQNVGVGPWNVTMTVISTHTDCMDCMNVSGCMDPIAINYDSSATVDDGSCQYPVYGCTDQLANNYDPNATVDDGSCVYEEEPLDCSNQLDIGCWVCKDPINFPGCQQLSNVNQVTMANNYGLQGFNLQQDCIDSTECGNNEPDIPCEDYVPMSNPQCSKCLDNIPVWQGSYYDINITGSHQDGCPCCKKDPCDKKYFIDGVMDQFNIQVPEFCKYCNDSVIQNPLCKCCKRFEKVKPRPKTQLGEEIKRIKGLL